MLLLNVWKFKKIKTLFIYLFVFTYLYANLHYVINLFLCVLVCNGMDDVFIWC